MHFLLLAIEVGDWQKADVLIGAIAAALLIMVIGIQIWTTRQATMAAQAAKVSADAAVEANQRAKLEMEVRLRPWINLGWPEARDILISEQITPHEESVSMPLDLTLLEQQLSRTPDARVIFQILVNNTGVTHAGDLNIYWSASSNEIETWNAIYENAKKGSLIVGPGEGLIGRYDDMPPETYVRYQRDEIAPQYLGVSVTYSDPFGGCWVIGVEFLLTGQAIQLIQGATPQMFSQDPEVVPKN